jgi:hypothetical protein
MAEQVRLAYRLDPAERESMGRRGREVYLERFNRSVQVANLERILREVVERP